MPQCGEGGRLVEDLIPMAWASKNPLRSDLASAGPGFRGPFSLEPATAGRHRLRGTDCRPDPWSRSPVYPFVVPTVTVTRRLRFNAAHRVHNPALSDAENAKLFGKCNNPNWHGHNYTLEVSVTGPVDPRTGYVMDLAEVRDRVTREVIDKVDHKNFNLDVDFMQGINPTSENIIVAMWNVIAPSIRPARLTHLRLWETDNNFVDYDGT